MRVENENLDVESLLNDYENAVAIIRELEREKKLFVNLFKELIKIIPVTNTGAMAMPDFGQIMQLIQGNSPVKLMFPEVLKIVQDYEKNKTEISYAK